MFILKDCKDMHPISWYKYILSVLTSFLLIQCINLVVQLQIWIVRNPSEEKHRVGIRRDRTCLQLVCLKGHANWVKCMLKETSKRCLPEVIKQALTLTIWKPLRFVEQNTTGGEGGWSNTGLCLASEPGNLHGFSGQSPVPVINQELHCRMERLKGVHCGLEPEEMVCCENRTELFLLVRICLEELLRLARKQCCLLVIVIHLGKCVSKWHAIWKCHIQHLCLPLLKKRT